MLKKRTFGKSIIFMMLIFTCIFIFSACKKEYNLVFVVEGETYHQIKTGGKENIKLPEKPEKLGYQFAGWYLDENTWEKEVVETTYKKTKIKADLSVYAKFDIVNYKITYQTDGGTHSNPETYTIEDEFNFTAASKANYEFSGWNHGSNAVTGIQKGTTGNITLTAIYDADSYQITYADRLDLPNDNNKNYYFGTELALKPLSKDGYEFLGWHDGTSIITKIEVGRTGPITLTANWELVTYDIDYSDKYNLAHQGVEEYNTETEVNLPKLSKTGYTFLGWNDGTSTISKIEKGRFGNLTLTAVWEETAYKITYSDKFKVPHNNKETYTIETEVLLDDIEKDGYKFLGWDDGTSFITKIEKGRTGNITLTANWEIVTYKIDYVDEFNTVHMNEKQYDIETEIELKPLAKFGYKFLGWDDGTSIIAKIEKGRFGNLTLTAKWEVITYNIKYVDQFNLPHDNQETYTIETEFSLEELSKDGYNFKGWHDGTSIIGKIRKGRYGELTLTATWEAKSYKITYVDEYSAPNNNPTEYTIEDTITLENLSKELYNFKGWDDGNGIITEIKEGTMGDLTLTAVWEEYVLTLTYNENKKDIKLTDTINAELFDATCVDNNGNNIDIEVTYTGDLLAGSEITVKLVATANGVTVEKEITNVKVYDLPTEFKCYAYEYLYSDDNLSLLFTGVDSFNQTIRGTYEVIEGSLEKGSTITLKGILTDAAGNTVENQFTFRGLGPKAGLFTSSSATITGLTEEGKATITELYLPFELNNIIMTRLGENAFINNGRLTKVVMPDSIDEIYGATFRNCINLSEVRFSEYLTLIRYRSFENTAITNLVLPNSLTNIAQYAFSNSKNLETVIMGENVRSMGERIFSGCTSLKYVEFSPSMNTVVTATFYGCSALETIVFKGEINTFNFDAFRSCSNLRSIFLPSTLTTMTGNPFTYCTSINFYLEEETVPSGWITSWNNVNRPVYYGVNETNFFDDGVLQYVIIDGKAVVTSSTRGQSEIVIPSYIMINAERYEVTSIASGAFVRYEELKSLFIPASIETMGSDLFTNCYDIVVYIEATGEKEGWDSTWNIADRPIVYQGIEETYTIDGIKYGINGTEATIISGSRDLTEVIIKDVITVNNVDYPVTAIESYAFTYSRKLKSITIPENIVTVGTRIVDGCVGIAIYVEAASAGAAWDYEWNWNMQSQTYYNKKTNFYYDEENGIEYTLLGLTATVAKYTKELSSITILESFSFNSRVYTVTRIGSFAFYGNTALTSISIPSTVTIIESSAFRKTGLKEVEIPSTVNSVRDMAFAECESLVKVTLPDGFKEISRNMFYRCYNLKEVNIPSGVESIGNSAFVSCSSLISIRIPSTVTSVAAGVFQGCYNTVIYLEAESVPTEWVSTWNPSNAIVYCGVNDDTYYTDGNFEFVIRDSEAVVTRVLDNGNQTVNIPKQIKIGENTYDVTTIGKNAFADTYYISRVIIDDNITTIEENAFTGYAALTIKTTISSDNVPETWVSGWNGGGYSVVYDYVIPTEEV